MEAFDTKNLVTSKSTNWFHDFLVSNVPYICLHQVFFLSFTLFISLSQKLTILLVYLFLISVDEDNSTVDPLETTKDPSENNGLSDTVPSASSKKKKKKKKARSGDDKDNPIVNTTGNKPGVL